MEFMHIHTVKAGDTIFKIARQHSTSPMKIIENNELASPDRLSVGQKLLILTPTRTYTVRGRDDLGAIADRFGVKRETLLRNNPYLAGTDKIYPGQLLAIKYDTAPYGIAAANGYYYKGTPKERFELALPYLTYVTVADGKREGCGINFSFDSRDVVRAAREAKKIPLMRVFDDETEFNDTYAENLIDTAKRREYSGIMLAPYRATRENNKGLSDFLIKLKKRAMEEDLLIFCELDGNAEATLPDVCDGYAISYEKGALKDIPSFADGEERVMRSYAENGESSKMYIEIPSFAYMGGEELTKSEAEKLAQAAGKEILYDEDKKTCHFDYNKYKAGKRETVNVYYESAENVKAKLDLIGELGFMGITFDIMRVPVEYLMMFAVMFNSPCQCNL
jgi:spore germination protein